VGDNSDKIILDLCGGTGSWSKPYKEAGYDVRVITLPEHNVFTYVPPKKVYGILAAPTCAHFSLMRVNPSTPRDLRKAMLLVRRCLEIIWFVQYDLDSETSKKTRLKFWALENPGGFLKFFLGRPAIEFDPYEYGDPYTKKTHIWGWFNIPPKNPVLWGDKKSYVGMGIKELRERNLETRKKFEYSPGCGLSYASVLRSITPQGFAQAFFDANP